MKNDSISFCFVVFVNPCFEHRHWKFEFEWAAASLRGTRPAWRACLTLGRRQASHGTRPAAASLPNPWGGGKPTRHEASVASLPNPWGGGKPTRHEASVASLPNPFLNFEFDLYYYMCACDDYHTLLIYIHTYMHHHSYIHHPIVYTCIIIVHHTYIHTCISPLYISITHLHASYIHTYIHTYIHHSSNLRLNAAEVIDVQWRVKIKNINNSHHHRQLSLPPSLSLSP